MVEVNMIHMSFHIFVSNMASRDSSPRDTLHSRMELLNGRTRPSWTWPIAWCHTRSYQMSIGLKLLDAQSTCSIDHPWWLSKTRFLKKHGVALRLVLLRVFGSVAFAHVPDELRRRLDKKSERCIFTGYSEQHKAYKLYNLVTKKFVVSKDIKFIEDKCWSDPS